MLRRLARSAIAQGLRVSGGSGALGRLSGVAREPLILGYHRVLPEPLEGGAASVPSMVVGQQTLERHLDFVGRRYRFVSLDEMGARIEAGRASGLAAVTFDDGYHDFYEHAFPLLQRKGIPAAIFVVTSLLEGGGGFLHDRVFAALQAALDRWGARRTGAFLAERGFARARQEGDAFAAARALLRSLDQASLRGICDALEQELGRAHEAPRSLCWDELAGMARAGLTVASHTRTHALLTRESPARVALETRASRAEIEARLGTRVLHFAYPDGCFDARAIEAVKDAGYRYAYTVCRHADPRHPLLTLPRRVLWEGSTLGALGSFSPAVLLGQINGIFDRAAACPSRHGAAEPAQASPRIAIVAPGLDAVGGQSVQAAALVAGLRREGVTVALLPTNPEFPRALSWLRRWPVLRTLLNQALYLPSLRRLHGADVVHVLSASYWSFLLSALPALLAGRAFGARVVLNYHSGEADDHLTRWGWRVHPWLRLAHQIVVPSEYLRGVFANHGYRARVVRNVVDTARYRHRERSPLQPRLLSTRNLLPHYRVDVVLDAFAILRRARPDATLTLAGSGSEEARLRRMAERIGGVSFVGRVPPAEMPDLYADADLFLNASVVDNQPLSLLEAFASGLPVVTTPTGGIAGMVRHGETGVLVPHLDPRAMAAAVLDLLADPGRALRLARAARRVAEAHGWPLVWREWSDVYAGGSSDAAPLAADADRRSGRSQPAGSLEVA